MSFFQDITAVLQRIIYPAAYPRVNPSISKVRGSCFHWDIYSPSSFANHNPRQVGDDVKPTALILDLGGVFCTFSAIPDAPIPPTHFKFLLNSSEWHSLESGKAPACEVYKALKERFALAEGALEETIRLASSSLAVNEDLVAAIKRLKQDSDGRLRVFAASNMSHDSYDIVRAKLRGWEVFDDVFTSANLGARKPEHAFFDRVLKAAGLTAESTVFIDDNPENVICAQCHGMRGVLFDKTDIVLKKLHALFGDPVQRGKAWLRAHAKDMWCVTNTGVEVQEQFQQLLMLHLLNDWCVVS